MIMKQNVIVWMVLSLFLLGCSKDDKVVYETENALLNQNNITDVVQVFQEVSQEEGTLLYGNRKGKDWFGLFNSSSGMLQEEWYGKDRYYERPEAIEITDTPSPFKKLQNGNYAYVYYFYPEDIEQAVYLCDNQKVEYGFELNKDIQTCAPIEKDCFLAKVGLETFYICDFGGNIRMNDVYPTDSLYTGFQDDKVWIGYYNNDGLWQEAIGVEPFEKNRRVHFGYNEYKEFSINQIKIGDYEQSYDDKSAEKLIATDWGIAFIAEPYSYGYNISSDAFLVNDNIVYYYTLPIVNGSSQIQIRNWFDGNILANRSILLSPTAKLLAEFVVSVGDADEIISLNEGIRYNNRIFSLLNYAEGETIWETGVEKLYSVPSDARIIMTVKDKGATLWLYHCDIVNLDGSRSAFEFDLNIETGEISYR